MAKRKRRLDFEIGKLTSSIENTLTGEVFETEMTRLHASEKALIKKKDWRFDWIEELNDRKREVYALTTIENPEILHGIVSFAVRKDHIHMYLLENAEFNQGNKKIYDGVALNLVAFVCKNSFERGFEGTVAFIAKSALLDHYEKKLGAKRIAGNRMFIDTREAYALVKQYYKDFDND
jgi:hypothetical protein